MSSGSGKLDEIILFGLFSALMSGFLLDKLNLML